MTNFIIRIYIEDKSQSKKTLIGEFPINVTRKVDGIVESYVECTNIRSKFGTHFDTSEESIYDIHIAQFDGSCEKGFLPCRNFTSKQLIESGIEEYVTTDEGKRLIKDIKDKMLYRNVLGMMTKPFVWAFKKIRKHIPFLIFVGLWCWGAMAIKNCANDHAEEEKNKEKTERMLRSSNNMNLDAPAALLDHGVADDNAEGGEVPQWCGELGGDTAKVRKIFLQSMSTLYGDNQRDPGRITFEIKGNNLYMYSYQFKEESTAWVSQIEFYQYFQDCDFDTVFAYAGNYGGAHGWTVYHRGDEKNEFGNVDDYPMPKHHNLWDLITDIFDGHIEKDEEEYDKVLDEYHAKKRKQWDDAANAYRAKFIAHKDSLYAQRRMKK